MKISSRTATHLPAHFACEVFGFSVRRAAAAAAVAQFAVRLGAAPVGAQAVVVLHDLVQLAGQVFLVRVLRGGWLVAASSGQLGVLQEQQPVMRRQRGLCVRAGEPVSGQQLRLLVRRVQVVEIVEGAAPGHRYSLVDHLRLH